MLIQVHISLLLVIYIYALLFRWLLLLYFLNNCAMYFATMPSSSQARLNHPGNKMDHGGLMPRNKPPAISNNNNEAGMGEGEKWRSMIDNCVIEFMAVLFINLTTIMCWDYSGDNQALQFIPALVLGLVLLCLKDEDYFFPDASHTVTLVMWALGGYHTWSQPCARLLGQTVGLAVSVWICSSAALPNIVIHVQHPLSIVFTLEMIGTALEHMAVVYVILPLLSPENSQGLNFKFPKVKPKSHKDTEAPSNQSVMHAAITFTGVHFCLWRSFNVEMNPSITVLLAYVRQIQNHESEHGGGGPSPWSHATTAVWGQLVGVLVCVVYTVLYVPRESKYWPAISKRANPNSNNANTAGNNNFSSF